MHRLDHFPRDVIDLQYFLLTEGAAEGRTVLASDDSDVSRSSGIAGSPSRGKCGEGRVVDDCGEPSSSGTAGYVENGSAKGGKGNSLPSRVTLVVQMAPLLQVWAPLRA